MRRFIAVVFIFWFSPAFADCYGIISLPLSMDGNQNQLQWAGSIGGSGRGNVNSTCTSSTGYKYDFRYNIVEQMANCVNMSTNQTYYAPVSTSGAFISSGAMDKLSVLSSGNSYFDVWGRLFQSPSATLPVGTGGFSGYYSTTAQIDISALPAGNYQCKVRNIHGAYGSNTNNIMLGVNKLFNLTLSSNGWATGYVDVIVNSACSVPDSIDINHGSVMTGSTSVKKSGFRVLCNSDNKVKITLYADSVSSEGVVVNVGDSGSKSILSLLDNSGNDSGNTLNVNVTSNTSYTFNLLSVLHAKGSGTQTGNAIARIQYD
ncbi:hypothetical protein RBH39_23615 [Escherichia coli]|uniref:hypothetical protein n=1 Tax=Escherichia coli TaxID=562 RepID=UPI002FCBF5A0